MHQEDKFVLCKQQYIIDLRKKEILHLNEPFF